MHIPYSMDDSEPDLYGGLGGHQPNDNKSFWEDSNFRVEYVECVKFFTQTDIDKLTKSLRSEIDEAPGLLSYIYNHAENLPSGVSQQIREQITKDRL